MLPAKKDSGSDSASRSVHGRLQDYGFMNARRLHRVSECALAGRTSLTNDATLSAVDELGFAHWGTLRGESLNSSVGPAASVPGPSTGVVLLMATSELLSRPAR